MNQELQKQLAAMLGKLVDVSADATKWAGQQIPPLVQEKISLGRVEETIYMVSLVIWLGLTLYLTRRLCGWAWKLTTDDEECLPAFCVPALVAVAGLVPFFMEVHDFAMVWFAPRLYIVEWLHTLVKG